MTEEISIKLDCKELLTLLRSNLSCHNGKIINSDLIDEISSQIAESIDFFLNKTRS